MIGTIAAAGISALAAVAAAAIPSLLDADATAPPNASSAPTANSRTSETPAPLTVAVQESEEYCRDGWIVAKKPSQLSEPHGEPIDWPAWAKREGGVRANRHEVILTIQGTTEARVVIDRIRVDVLEPRRPPIRGTIIDILCGEPFEYRYLEANLDRNPPTMTSKTTGSISGEPDVRLEPAKFPYQVAVDEAESFVVSSVVSKYDVDWRVEVDLSSQGRTGTVVVDDNGQPFHTSSSANAEATCVWADVGGIIKESSSGCGR